MKPNTFAWLVLGIFIGICLILLWKWNVIYPPNNSGSSSSSSYSSTSNSSSSSTTSNVACAKLENSDLSLDTPCMNATISGNTISVSGLISGSYTFEAQFTIKLLDKTGTVAVTQPVTVTGDWQSGGKVPFTTTLTHTLTSQNATLVFQNDNPSGLPENQKQIFVPIIIQ